MLTQLWLLAEERSNFIDHAVFREIGQFINEATQRQHWQSLLNSLQSALFSNLFATMLTMLGFLLGIVTYQRLIWFSDRTVKLAIRDQHISSYNVSRLFSSTIVASLLCWSPLMIVGCYFVWNSGGSVSPNFQQSLGGGLIAVFVIGVVFRLLQEFLSNGGLSEAIYGMKYTTARYVLNRLEMSVLFAAPLIFLIVFSSQFMDGRWYPSVGRLSFLIVTSLFFAQFHQLFWPASKLYERLLNDETTTDIVLVRQRVPLYIIGVALFLVAAGLTISGWFELAKSLSVNLALTMLAGVVAFTVRTIVVQKANELIRQNNLIEELGRTADSVDTVRNWRVQDFVRRYSATANRGVSFLAMASLIGISYLIWRDWISLPPELMRIRIGGVALAGLVGFAKLAGIGIVTAYLAKELPAFVMWCVSHQARFQFNNPSLVGKLIGAAIIYSGVWLALRSVAWELPVIPWLGTLLTISILFASKNFISDGFAGLVLLFDPRIEAGDSIEVVGSFGRVESVGLFTTIVEDNLGSQHIVPNSTMIHATITKTRDQATIPMLIEVSLPRDCDAYQAQVLMMMVAQREPNVVQQPPPHIRFVAFRTMELQFEIRLLVLASSDFEATKARIEDKLAIEFDRHEIESPTSEFRESQPAVGYREGRAG